MIVYRDARREVDARRELAELGHLAAAGDALNFLVRLGELEQAALDAVHSSEVGWTPLDAALRRALLGAAGEFLASERRPPRPAPLEAALAAVQRETERLPSRLVVRQPEGYAHYALDPRAYARAAASYRAEAGPAHAARAVVLGVRSIGTSLSAVVAAAVGSAATATVRPRGPSGERLVRAGHAFVARLSSWLGAGGDVLLVDEGPGATGETFAAVAAWLRELGVEERRIVLFPSRGWGMPLAPPERVAWFERTRKYPPPLGDARPARIAERLRLGALDDLGAGRWREELPGAASFPAAPGHERAKYRAAGSDGAPVLVRYAGLGRWGTEALERARRLADRGAGPEPLGASDGFLVIPWVEGTPISPRTGRDPAFVAALGDYLTTRGEAFRTGHDVDRAPVREALRANAAEALGDAAPGLRDAILRLERLPAQEAVVPDARLQRREWLRTASGFAKVDAIDHGDGLRLPGPTDAAWDVAGAVIEFGLERAAAEALVRRCAGAMAAEAASLAEAVAAYLPAYAAVQLADAMLALHEAAAPLDRARWAREARRYRAALEATLASTTLAAAMITRGGSVETGIGRRAA